MRRRLVLGIAGVAVLAVVLFAVPLAVLLKRTYRDDALLRLQRDTVAATRQIDVAVSAADRVELPPTPRSLTVYGLSGRRIAGRGGPVGADELVREALRTRKPAQRVGGGRVTVAVPLVTGERVTGAVRAESADSAGAGAGRLRSLAVVAVAVVVLSVIAAAVLGRRLARPLERLSDAARRLGEGDFSVRAPRSGVTEVDAVAGALDTAAGRLDDLVTRERAFSADASHQLRTPLAALRIELEALELRGASSPELTSALGQVDRLQGTVETLLGVARDAPRGGALTGLHAPLEAAELRWRGPLGALGRPLRVHLEDGALSARVSPAVLAEILDVLIDNAMRHGAGVVTITGRRAAQAVALDVADEGPGPEQQGDELFARRSGDAAGHGIGLSLARSLAHAEGGRLVLGRRRPPVFTLFLLGADA